MKYYTLTNLYRLGSISTLAIAKETKDVVQKEEEEATQKAQMTQEIADSAQRDLDEALPALVSTQHVVTTVRMRVKPKAKQRQVFKAVIHFQAELP